MEKITVHNRIQMMIASKWKIAAKWILIVCGVILVVGALIALVMGDEINLFGEVVFPILLFIYVYRMNGTTRGYVMVPLEICFEKDVVRFEYPEIDRRDRKGVHRETYIYRSEDVMGLQCGMGGREISVTGTAEYTGEYPNGKREYINGREQQMSYDFRISLLDEKEVETVINGLQKSLSRIIERV